MVLFMATWTKTRVKTLLISGTWKKTFSTLTLKLLRKFAYSWVGTHQPLQKHKALKNISTLMLRPEVKTQSSACWQCSGGSLPALTWSLHPGSQPLLQASPWSIKTPGKCPNHCSHLHARSVSEPYSLHHRCFGTVSGHKESHHVPNLAVWCPQTFWKMVNSLTQINYKGVKN